MSLTIMRRIKFCAGHRLYKHGGKCEHFHGHNYVADFFLSGESQDSVGRVVDFATVKAKCKGWLDQHWDHSFLVFEDDKNAIAALSQVQPCRMFLLRLEHSLRKSQCAGHGFCRLLPPTRATLMAFSKGCWAEYR